MTERPPPPNTPPDLSALARKTLDIWQDQIGRMSQDPGTLDLMTRTFAMMTKGSEALQDLPKAAKDMASLWPQTDLKSVWPGPGPSDRSTPGESTTHAPAAAAQPGPATGAAPAADVPRDGTDLVAELLRRIADLEDRVRTLESGSAGGDAKPARRRKPG